MKSYKLRITNYKKWGIENRELPARRSLGGGFTLIEVLVASAILVILAFGFLGLQYIIGQNQVSVWRNYLSIESANTAVSTLSKELRDARQSATGAYPIEVAGSQGAQRMSLQTITATGLFFLVTSCPVTTVAATTSSISSHFLYAAHI